MKKLIATSLAILALVGCSAEQPAKEEQVPAQRFVYERNDEVPGGTGYIITDTTTDVQYLYIDHGYDGGMVKLEPAVEVASDPEPEPLPDAELVSLGEFTITHYCCEKRKHICGTGDGITASGIPVEPGLVAVDPKVIPLGSTVIINGQDYYAADTGGAIKGNRIDIAVATHEEAEKCGVKTAEVFIVRKDGIS